MTSKTCKILTRLKTAPHVSVARRMELFAKHVLSVASWLEQLYPSQHSASADCSLGLWKLAVFRKTLLCRAAVPLLCVLSLFQQHCMKAQLSGSCSPAVAHHGSSRAETTPLPATESTRSISTCARCSVLLEPSTRHCLQKFLRTVREVTGRKCAYLCTVSAIKHIPLDSL